MRLPEVCNVANVWYSLTLRSVQHGKFLLGQQVWYVGIQDRILFGLILF